MNSLYSHMNDLQVIPRQMEDTGSSTNSFAIMRRISRGNEARDLRVGHVRKRGHWLSILTWFLNICDCWSLPCWSDRSLLAFSCGPTIIPFPQSHLASL